MRLLEPVLVAVFRNARSQSCLLPDPCCSKYFWAIMFNPAGVGNFCVAWRLLSRFLADPIRLPFLRCAAVLCAMRVERRNAAHDKRRRLPSSQKTEPV